MQTQQQAENNIFPEQMRPPQTQPVKTFWIIFCRLNLSVIMNCGVFVVSPQNKTFYLAILYIKNFVLLSVSVIKAHF